MRIVGLLLLLSLFLGCSNESKNDIQKTERKLTAHEELRIGTAEDDENYMFGNVDFVAIGTNGSIFVGDRQGPIVRMYDKEGTFIKNVGREGRGPGEYIGINGMKTFKDGRLAIWNVRAANLSVFSSAGEHQETHLVNSTLYAPDLFEVGNNGEFYVKMAIDTSPDKPNWHMGWLKVSPEGNVIDTLAVPRDNIDHPQTFVLSTAQGSVHSFITRPISTISSEGYIIYAFDNQNYSIDFLEKQSTVGKIEKKYTPVPLLSDEKEQWIARNEVFKKRGAVSIVPDYKPAFRQFFTDRDSRIWVWRYVAAELTDKRITPEVSPGNKYWEPPTFDIFLPDGSFYGTVSLPINANFKDAKGETVVAVLTGDMGEEYVVRYSLREHE